MDGEKAGYAYKSDHKQSHWKRRFFKLDDEGVLHSFANKSSKKEKNAFKLKDHDPDKGLIAGAEALTPGKAAPPSPFVCVLLTKGRQLNLAFESQIGLDMWLAWFETIERSGRDRKSSIAHPATGGAGAAARPSPMEEAAALPTPTADKDKDGDGVPDDLEEDVEAATKAAAEAREKARIAQELAAEQEAAAARIQAILKGNKDRKRTETLKAERDEALRKAAAARAIARDEMTEAEAEEEKEAAAARIQTLYRMRNARGEIRELKTRKSALAAFMRGGGTAGEALEIRNVARFGTVEDLEESLKEGADIKAKDADGLAPLLWAAARGATTIVKRLVSAGAPVNDADNWGKTALMDAAAGGFLDAVIVLLDKGADPNQQDANGETALMWAVANGHGSVARALLTHDANPDIQSNEGMTALMLAAAEGHSSCIRRLTTDGRPKLELMDNLGRTALAHAQTDAEVEALIEAGANPKAISSKEHGSLTVLHWAASAGHTTAVRQLCRAGVSVNKTDAGKKTALHHAAAGGFADVVLVLLRKGAKVDAKDKVGETPLIMAAAEGHAGVCIELLLAGADDTVRAEGFSAIMRAEEGGHKDAAHVIAASQQLRKLRL